MHEFLEEIPSRILEYAKGALTQANHHSVFYDPDWGFMSVTNTAQAGELFIKAIIAKEHPLLIFKNIFEFDDGSDRVELKHLWMKGKTHEFTRLPKLLWAVTGERIPDMDSFNQLRNLRNNIMHFCADPSEDFNGTSLKFIYSVIDPLINKHFGLNAIEFHEDHSVGYDYVVKCLLSSELRFSMPEDFNLTEISLKEEIKSNSEEYIAWLTSELKKLNRLDLIQ